MKQFKNPSFLTNVIIKSLTKLLGKGSAADFAI